VSGPLGGYKVDAQTTINLIGGGALTVLGWIGKTVYDATKSLEHEVRDLQIELPKSYVTKQDFKNVMDDIKGMFQRIETKLDAKADKRV
jgi:hypothetical protein